MSTFYNLPSTGEQVTLFTQLVVREDAHLLFGFGTAEDALFRNSSRSAASERVPHCRCSQV